MSHLDDDAVAVTTRGASSSIPMGVIFVQQVLERNKFFISKCMGEKVLHLGPVDYHEDMVCGLHRMLMNVTDAVVGIDIDKHGIERAKMEGIENIYYGNLEELDKVNVQDTFDIIAAVGVIEHLSNPGLFLEGIKRFFAPSSEMIIETPNAFSAHRFLLALTGFEYVHRDHVCYYSYITLRNLLSRHGYIIKEELSHVLGGHLTSLRVFISKVNFNFANGFIFIVNMSSAKMTE